ncbi:CDP-glycerol glycerophosphotransferase family protein [Acinetobacter lwoffii]|uniref:CDP-glycerol glycerophosphotransferase family protein n=1 Tax=Acinetobacter lwoffii TaxID=28090 RepID=A0AAW8AWC5_ACILW|nr:CDP-glycerol glycerophosphotransferase family protein [Acinetobacter lwoffii]MDP1370052.1 CDP-glycerol glycerophosphotransferase family protein [Acinetobacter lwoffii]MDP1389503.1 CDP-glycerol glycerophosphotransferase family protein [Acinetobacter lwoffii]MDP1447134.1 CDP-glycerol glycerophosphotransferase family protein [Acinetobacter lwoffii]
MTTEIKDLNIIKSLLDFYSSDLDKGFLHPRTNEIVYLDEDDFTARVNFLNLALYKPEVIYVWGGDLAYSQLEIWAPLIKKSKLKHAIFCKSLKGKTQAHAKLEKTPIFGIKEGFDTKNLANFSTSVHSMLYMTDKNENFGYMRAYPNLIHIAAHHGDSDKHASFNRLFGAFDYLLVADKNSMNRYLSANIQLTSDHFLTIGNSVIDGVTVGKKSNKLKNVLYAPTFEGHGENVNYSSVFRAGNSILESNNINLMLRPHPGMGLREQKYKIEVERLKLKSVDNFKKNKMKQFNWSDVLICDISGVLSEYLFTEKPIIVPVSSSDGWLYNYIKNLDISKYVYLWDYNDISLDQILLEIEDDDSLYESRSKRRNELYCGVESIEQSVGLYDKALQFTSQVKYWRDIKNISNFYKQESFLEDPKDPNLLKIVNEIRQGYSVLKFEIV